MASAGEHRTAEELDRLRVAPQANELDADRLRTTPDMPAARPAAGESLPQRVTEVSAQRREAFRQAEGKESSDEIRRDIERTRAEMGVTIDAIQDRLGDIQYRLQPKNLMQEAKDRVRDATVGRIEDMTNRAEGMARDTGSSFLDTIRANPIPSALVAVGLGWLWMNRRSSSHRTGRSPADFDDRIWDSQGNLIGYRREPRLSMGGHEWERRHESERFGRQQSSGGMRGQIGEMTGQARQSVGEMASGAAGTVSDVASEAANRAGEMASTTFDSAGQMVSGAGYQMQRAQSTFERALHDSPMAVGALALAAGVAVGLTLPETERERELMGDTRESLMNRAQDMFEDAQEKAKRVASEAQRAAMSEAENQGLAPSS